MSDNGEVEVESPAVFQVLPKDVASEIGTVKLFNKWSYEDVEIRDISLTYVLSFRFTRIIAIASKWVAKKQGSVKLKRGVFAREDMEKEFQRIAHTDLVLCI